jgi:hypothetical protein
MSSKERLKKTEGYYEMAALVTQWYKKDKVIKKSLFIKFKEWLNKILKN